MLTRPTTDSWTIHGLWPDNCDGSYPAKCDSDRVYTNLGDILTAAGARSTLAYMARFWKAYRGSDDHLWEHEWAKHCTCVSTLEPSCYGAGYREAEEAVAYFVRTVALFKTLPTHRWLADADIEPSSRRSYARDDVQDALARRHGAPVTLRCRDGDFKEVWYHFNVRGSLQEGKFVPAEPDGPKGSCPDSVWYLPKAAERWTEQLAGQSGGGVKASST